MTHRGDSLEPTIIFISGPLHAGKTTLAKNLADRLKAENIRVKGFLALGEWAGTVRLGFKLLELSTSQIFPLATYDPSLHTAIPFAFSPEGIARGKRALSPDTCRDAQVVFLDEIGKLELSDKGWAPCLEPLLTLPGILHIWIVRDTLIDSVCDKWKIKPLVVSAQQPGALEALLKKCRELLP